MAAPISIYLATPCYGGLAHAIYMSSLLALRPACAARSVALHVDLGGGEALIGRGRAVTLTKFLASGASHLLFIDADIGFTPQAVFRLIEAGVDVIGGVYPRKAPARTDELDELPPGQARIRGDLRTVAAVGAGFLLIGRSAAVRITDAYPNLKASLVDMPSAGVPETVMVFDSMIDPETRLYLSDYQAFCHRWRALGGDIWADPGGRLVHVGSLVSQVG